MPSVHFNGPVLVSRSYAKGSFTDGPITQVLNAEFQNLCLDFNNTNEIVVGAAGPWTLGLAIGASAAPAITAVTPAVGAQSLANFDPGTAANTGQEWHLSNAGNNGHTTASSPGADFLLSARMTKNGNADTFGSVSLSNAPGVLATMTTAGAMNVAGGRAFYIHINGSGTVTAGMINVGGLHSFSTFTDRNFALNEQVDVSIVGKKFKALGGGNWTGGSVEWYVRGKKVHQLTSGSTGGPFAWTNGEMFPTVAVVNGTSTVGHTRLDYINWTVSRGPILP